MHNNHEKPLGHTTQALIGGYQVLFEQYYNKGWPFWFCTVQFNHLSDNQRVAIAKAKAGIERIYCTLLTTVIRRPRNLPVKSLPLLVGCPDSPVAKRKPTTRLADMLPNNGMHWHAALFLPEPNQLKLPFDQHVEESQQMYWGRLGYVSRLTVQTGEVHGRPLADYLFKSIKRGTYTWDDVLILPRSSTEVH